MKKQIGETVKVSAPSKSKAKDKVYKLTARRLMSVFTRQAFHDWYVGGGDFDNYITGDVEGDEIAAKSLDKMLEQEFKYDK